MRIIFVRFLHIREKFYLWGVTEPKMNMSTPKQVTHGGVVWNVVNEYVADGRAMYALSRVTYYGEPLFCSMPVRFCFAA